MSPQHSRQRLNERDGTLADPCINSIRSIPSKVTCLRLSLSTLFTQSMRADTRARVDRAATHRARSPTRSRLRGVGPGAARPTHGPARAPLARSGGRRGEGPSTEGGRSGRWRVAEAGGPRTRYGLRRSTAPHTTRTTHVTQTHRLYITILYFTLHARCTCSHTHMHMNPHAHAHAQFFA